jgi:hypothetical protein
VERLFIPKGGNMARPIIDKKYSFSIGGTRYQAKDIHYG